MTTTALQTQTQAAFTVPDIERMAQAVARSGLFPGAKSPEAAMALMLLSQAEGLHPMQAMRRYHIIEGQPSMRADAILAEYQRQGGKVEWIESTETRCEAVFVAPGIRGEVRVAWTMDDAKRAGLAGRAMWAKYPRQMLRSRVVSEGIRMAMPGVVVGIYEEGEVQDIVLDRQEARRAQTPAPIAIVPATPAPEADDVLLGPQGASALLRTVATLMPRQEGETDDGWKVRMRSAVSAIVGYEVESREDVARLSHAQADRVVAGLGGVP